MSDFNEKDIPTQQNFLENLGKIAKTLDRVYLSELSSNYEVVETKSEQLENYYASHIRALRIKKCVVDKEERVEDCFKNIISLCGGINHALAVVFKRTKQETKMFFVLKAQEENVQNDETKKNFELLKASVNGNFPGTEIEDCGDFENFRNELDQKKASAVSIMSGIPSEKSEKFISQGIEKLLNGVIPKGDKEQYTVVLLAEPVSIMDIRTILNGYEELATAIAPYAGYQFLIGSNVSETKGKMYSLSQGTSISDSISKTHSVNIGVNGGYSFGMPGPFLGVNLGYGYSWGTTHAKAENEAEIKGENSANAVETSESSTYTYKFYTVGNILKKLEATIERIDKSKSGGLWQTAAYVFSEDSATTVNVANYLRSIFMGDESYIEPFFIQTWTDKEGDDNFQRIREYICHFCHPVFKGKNSDNLVTPTLNVSTTELANIFEASGMIVGSLPVS